MTSPSRSADQSRPEVPPKIRSALRFYQITSYVTGVLLLLLVIEMVLKYAYHLEVEAFGPFGAIALVQEGTVTTGINLSRWILIVHGWFYVVYLVACYLVWQRLRWSLLWLLAMAGGGVVPFLSFVTEALFTRKAYRELARRDPAAVPAADDAAELAELEAGLDAQERRDLDAAVAAELRARQDPGTGRIPEARTPEAKEREA